MLSLRLNNELETYLDKVTNNKSDYVRKLIEKDKEQNDDYIDLQKEIEECTKSFEHFVKNYCRLPNPKENMVKVKSLFDHQEHINNLLQLGRNAIVNKSRQVGVTTSLALVSLWLVYFHNEISVAYFAQQKSNMRFHEIISSIDDSIPDFLKVKKIGASNTVNNLYKFELRNGSSLVSCNFRYSSNLKVEEFDFVFMEEVSYGPYFNNRGGKDVESLKRNFKDKDDSSFIITSTGIKQEDPNYNKLVELVKEPSVNYLEIEWNSVFDRNLDDLDITQYNKREYKNPCDFSEDLDVIDTEWIVKD